MSDPLNPYASPQAEFSATRDDLSSQRLFQLLQTTRTGLSLVYYGILLMLLAIVVSMPLFLLIPFMFGPGRSWAILMIPPLLIGIGIFLGAMLVFVGHLFCIGVPAESRAKGFIVWSVILTVANIAFTIFKAIAPLSVPPVASEIVGFPGLASTVLFALFLRGVSKYIARADLVRKASIVLVLEIILAAIAIGINFLGLGQYDPDLHIPGPAVAILGLVGLIVFVMTANLVNALRKAIPRL